MMFLLSFVGLYGPKIYLCHWSVSLLVRSWLMHYPSRLLKSLACFILGIFFKSDHTVCCCIVLFYQQHCTQRKAPVFKLLRGRFWCLSPCRGDTLHWWGWNLAQRRGSMVPSCKYDLTV